jgi:hypothetical protein
MDIHKLKRDIRKYLCRVNNAENNSLVSEFPVHLP